ncbi:FAD-binding oxidoreductase [Rhodococcus sp. KBW08]|uniref:FAD-binding oxidoreductase n=1 Tax=Rhodococcus sp. KBW08 TaxID=2144188 RepID=UPI000F5B209B|nr:FAD-linked oxidase C-terminal domain-containing protein [Rhodococcus sp. KBW08]RQO46028.1 FAD-binding oxidoreductase [Rhodococcus sp. KBW08]
MSLDERVEETPSPTAQVANQTAIEKLESVIPKRVVTQQSMLEKYRYDHIRYGRAGRPLAAARPETTEDVQACLRWATEHRVPVITRGAGTGLSGGAQALDGALILSTEAMKHIDVDGRSRVVYVQPGALTGDVKRAAATEGLHYAPDPASFEISSIGGNLATNAGGLCCVKYGVTSTYVLGLDVVLADGRLLRLGGATIKNVAGLPLTQLFVGSEGTLGVIVGATLRLVPPPATPSTVVATFRTLHEAGETVVDVGRTVRPSMMELLDRVCIGLLEDYRPMGLDRTSSALLIAQCDRVADARAIELIAAQHGAIEVHLTEDPKDGELLVEARRSVGAAHERRGTRLSEDVAVPVGSLAAVLARIEQIGNESDMLVSVVAHAGDGNLHPTIFYDSTDELDTGKARDVFEKIMRIAIAHGGTITGEHGVGRSKRFMVEEQLGAEVVDVTRRLKQIFDPLGLLNPGVGF